MRGALRKGNMRRFVDPEGAAWDVVLGRESWGTLVALFVPSGAPSRAVRQTMLDAPAYEEAQNELDTMTDEELRRLLARSTLKDS